MLTKCPECSLQASDKALYCPHCGFPFQKDAKQRARKKTNKRKRLPNGFGQITEIKNRNLRNPFRAMVTVGKNDVGRPICKTLKPQCFFATYNEAYEALVEYNRNPYSLDQAITVSELYDKWFPKYIEKLTSDSGVRAITSAWAYCSEIYNMRVMDVRARHIKGCMEDGVAIIKNKEHHPTPSVQQRIKSMFNMMLDYAVEYEIVDKNYARTFTVSDDVVEESEAARKPHIDFTPEELQKLWDNVDYIAYADLIIIQCYSGWRPRELGLIELGNVDLDNWFFTGGMKTTAGINRPVPIHSKIRGLVKRRYDEAVELGSKYLFNCTDACLNKTGIELSYGKYSDRFDKVVKRLALNPEHRPHDPRMEFVTMAKKAGVDEYAIKYIVGHVVNDITEKIYTNRDRDWLRSEIEKIK